MVVRMRVLEFMYYDNLVHRVISFSIMEAAEWKTRGPWGRGWYCGIYYDNPLLIMTIPDSRVLLYCA